MNRFVRRTGLSVAAGMTLLALLPGVAAADETPDPGYYKNGTLVADSANACLDGNNVGNGHVVVCFASSGDKLYVRDVSKDGRSAYGEFDEHYTSFSGGDYKTCRNPHGYNTWAVCDYTILANTRVKFFGYTRDNEGTFSVTRDVTAFVTDWNPS